MTKLLLAGILSLTAAPAGATDPLCVPQVPSGILLCDEFSVDWYESYTGIVSTANFIFDKPQAATVTVNAPILGDGGVPDPVRLDVTSVTLQGNAFNGADQLLLLDSQGRVPLPGLEQEFALKEIDENLNNDTVLQEDDELIVTHDKTFSTYTLTAYIVSSAQTATPDIKWAFGVPQGSTMTITYLTAADTSSTFRSETLTDSQGASGEVPRTSSTVGAWFTGTITLGSLTGNTTFFWAQQTTNVNNTTVHSGSWLRVRRQ